jgi:putative transposase
MADRSVTLFVEAVRYGCRKFGQVYAKRLRRRRPRPGGTWHLEVCQTQPMVVISM